jgi:hypothetical protein
MLCGGCSCDVQRLDRDERRGDLVVENPSAGRYHVLVAGEGKKGLLNCVALKCSVISRQVLRNTG